MRVTSGGVEQGALLLIRRSAALAHLRQVHARLLKTSLDRNTIVLAQFLRRCFAARSPEALTYGRSLFDRLPHPDTFVWNTVMRAYLRAREPRESLLLFRRMQLGELAAVDSFTLSLAIQACARCRSGWMHGGLHGRSIKLGFVSDLFVQTALVEMYAKLGDVATARRVFDEIPPRDLVSHNVMLAVYVACGDLGAARRLFDEMPERDVISWNTMIHGFAACSKQGAEMEAFDRSHEKGLISWSWNSGTSAYGRSGLSGEAVRLFEEMRLRNIMPDRVTMMSLLSACGNLGALSTGKMIHDYMERNKFEVDLKLGTSLLDMYAKCGDIENSLKIFKKMKNKDVFAWSAMITGLANHGQGDLALTLFSEMLSDNVEPNDNTFIGVLTACSHSRLVCMGRAHFDSMVNIHGIAPKIEHYGCLVDLLGRAGHLEAARHLIRDMPFEPDAVIWRPLLGGCRIHKNVELAEEAALQLVKLESQIEGHYILLSNVLAQAGRWDGVATVRKMMREKGVQKVPGSSSIEIDSTVHGFVAGDRSHPESNKIYEMLAEMDDLLRKAGHKPMTSLVL